MLKIPSRLLTLGATVALSTLLTHSIATAQAGRRTDVVDPNVATEKELLALPHMNPTIVKQVIGSRPFLSMVALDSLLSRPLSAEQRTALYRRMFVQVNLNTASKQELQLIPGMGNRMVHEFEEYRPYKALAQFRREIGKYVDNKELARLEQYVFVPMDLNTASDEDLLSIPGVGPKLLHEFKEYRPYKGMPQFRREIGKYVNAKELARLERHFIVSAPKP